MKINLIVAELDKEIARLQQARALLAGNVNEIKPANTKRRILSAEARKKIAEAQKKRWAQVKKPVKYP